MVFDFSKWYYALLFCWILLRSLLLADAVGEPLVPRFMVNRVSSEAHFILGRANDREILRIQVSV